MNTHSSRLSGSLPGGILLIAGSCIGAAMLGLPVISALAGFVPTTVLFLLSWLFMVATGLLLLEVNLWFEDEVSIISMAGRTIGTAGKAIGWVSFLFLFYALMVAFIGGTGKLISDFYHTYAGTTIPTWIGSTMSCVLFGFMVYLGTRAVDLFNRVLMAGLIAAYIGLMYFGLPHVNLSYLKHSDWSVSYLAIPAMIISFGYHNLIPTLKNYMHGDLKRLRLAILIGSAIPLVIYLLWEWLILGIVPLEGEGGFRHALSEGDLATHALKNTVGGTWVSDLAHYFAFFAMVTTFLGVSLSFVDFLSDGLHIKKDPKGKVLLCLMVLALPLILALAYPKIFLIALSYAGSFGCILLFALLPAAMAWNGRYRLGINGPRLLPGGKLSIAAIVAVSILVIGLQIMNDLLN